jgi:hypothetical protein
MTDDAMLRARGWTLLHNGYWSHPNVSGPATTALALDVQRARDERRESRPRPTCGTGPHFSLYQESGGVGECLVNPPVIHEFQAQTCDPHYGVWPLVAETSRGCGQHPDMPAWIEAEWPKVTR